MAMTNCPECGHMISTKALTCPHCGCPLPEDAPFRKIPDPIDPSWTSRYSVRIHKRKAWHWAVFWFTFLLFATFLCLCFLNKKETHVWGDKYEYSIKVVWLAFSCVFGAFTIISLGFAIGVSARLQMRSEMMHGYTVVVYVGLLLVSVIIENKPAAVFFRKTFFKRGFASLLPDETNFYGRYKQGEIDFSFIPFDPVDNPSGKPVL